MLRYKALYDFEHLPFLEHANFAKNVATRIDGSEVFDAPPKTSEQLNTAAQAEIDAYAAYTLNGGKDEHIKLLASNVELSGMLKLDADYVTMKADGDKYLIHSAGYHATKDREVPEKPPYSVKAGDTPGTVVCHFYKDDDTVSVVWICYKQQNPPIIGNLKMAHATTSNTFEIKGLESGAYYCFYAAPVRYKSDGTLEFMPMITCLVP